jgi:hypothetical protein
MKGAVSSCEVAAQAGPNTGLNAEGRLAESDATAQLFALSGYPYSNFSDAHPTMDDPFIQHFLEIRLGGRYQICRRIGSGSFGKVYIGTVIVLRDTMKH